MSNLASNPIMSGDGSVVFSDNTGTPITITLPFEHGNFSFGEVTHLQKEVIEFYARDRWYAAREGKDITPEFTFSADLPGLTDATTKSIWDMVRRSEEHTSELQSH